MKTTFCCGMEKCYVVNPSYISQVGFNIIKPTVNPVTQEKVHLLQVWEFDKIQETVDKSQLE